MCGIFGLVRRQDDLVPDPAKLSETARLLSHRGPDHHGCFTGPGIGLAHTRLSLLDLNERSNQPFWDRSQRYSLVYNGEIYNFAELRRELERDGVAFRTSSDTEVLLESILAWGLESALRRFEGMFAFGFYDRQERSLLIARDRFGIKPLFYCETDEQFLFASEIRAMGPWLKFEPDLFSISAFLFGSAGPYEGHTFFRGVRILDPGTYLILRPGQVGIRSRFFSHLEFFSPEQAQKLSIESPASWVDRVDELLNQSIQSQLVADAPVGALCSGGLDSSLIMAVAARYHSNLAIFHANVVGPTSETDAAVRLAEHLKLDLQVVEVRDSDFVERMPLITLHYGHPYFANPQCVPFQMVSQKVRESGVKAVLTGEGSDECFLGYDWLAPNVADRRHYSLRSLRKFLKRFLGRRTADLQSQYWGPIWEGDNPVNFAGNQKALVNALYNRFAIAAESAHVRQHLGPRTGESSRISQIKSFDLLNYNLRSLLHRNDCMGMSASIESRFPFLDTRLVEYAINLPNHAKIRFSPTYLNRDHYFFKDKWVLRKVAERYLPRDLSQRRKLGFPVSAPNRISVPPEFFHDSYLRRLFELSTSDIRFLLGNARQSLKLRLLQFEVWANLFLEKRALNEVTRKVTQHVTVAPLKSV